LFRAVNTHSRLPFSNKMPPILLTYLILYTNIFQTTTIDSTSRGL
jgi:hypothetical protein